MSSTAGSDSRPRRYFYYLVLLLLILRVAAAVIRTVWLLPMRTDITFPEGAVVARASDAASGKSAYKDWREWPHQFAPYGPLTYYPVGVFARLLGLSSSPTPLYVLGRLQSMISLTGIAVLIFLIVRKLGGSPLFALIGVTAFSAWKELLEYVASYRPDAPQACLSLAALYLAMSGPATRRRIAVALGLLWISFWFKPASWGIFFGLGVWIASAAGVRAATGYLSAFAVSGLATSWILDRLLGGQLFLNMVTSLDNGWKTSNLAAFYSHVPAPAGLVLMVGIFSLLLAHVRVGPADLQSEQSRSPGKLFTFAALASFVATSAQNLKVGADINYYLEAYALTSIAMAWTLARLWDGEFFRDVPARALALGLILFPLATFDITENLRKLPGDLRTFKLAWNEPPITSYARQLEGPLLTTNPFLALTTRAPSSILDHVQFQILAERGRLDPSGLLKRLDERHFGAVVLASDDLTSSAKPPDEPPLYTAGFETSLHTNYELTLRNGPFLIFTPRK